MKLERVVLVSQSANRCVLQFTFAKDGAEDDFGIREFVSKFGEGATIIAIASKTFIFVVPDTFLARGRVGGVDGRACIEADA